MADYVLVAEDNADIQELITYNLKQEGFDVGTVASGDEVIPSVKKRKPDVLLLDLMLPKVSGTEICRQLRQDENTRHLPIIMVTAKGTETDKIVGLELGADDYVTKPFSPKELVARTKALIRRARPSSTAATTAASGVLRAGDLEMDLKQHRVQLANQEIALTLTEFNILRELISSPGDVLSRGFLMHKAIGVDVSVTDRTIDVHMAALRKKLGAFAENIETVRGVGYRFKAPDS